MKATEVLQLYADGKRDFSGANLRGASFKGKDISGANFSETDIRGANFSHANLTGAKFRGAKAGIQRRWAIILVISSWILSGLSGILSVLIIDMVSPLLGSSNRANTISNWVSLIALAVFFFITIRKGLVAGFIAVGVTVGIAIGVAVSDEREAWLRTIAIAIAATGGTSFRYADLTDADFTSATLKSTDFRNANFNRTNY